MINFPFQNLTDDHFISYVNSFQYNSNFNEESYSIDELNSIIFDQYNLNTDSDNVHCFQTDPNQFFMHESNLINSTKYFLLDDIKDIKKSLSGDTFSLCSFNINSLSKHFNEFINDIFYFNDNEVLNFDVYGFTETKITDEIEHLFELPNYHMYTYNCRRNSGGVALYVNGRISDHKERLDLRRSMESFECLFVEFNSKPCPTICGIIYHRPGVNNNEFISELSSILSLIISENKNIHLMGDFNVDLLSWSRSALSRELVDICHSNNLFCTIDKPTRVTLGSKTLIDHIWSNQYPYLKLTGIMYSNITDHFPVFSIFHCNNEKRQNNNSKKKLFLTHKKLNLISITLKII